MASVGITPCSFFQVDGYRLQGRCYELVGTRPNIGVVFAHGFNGTQDIVAPAIARALVERGGCSVLTFDYAGFGESDGPQGRLDPERQLRDCRAAVAWLRSHRTFPSGVGIVGLSIGAGTAVLAAEHDPTIRFVAGISSIADGGRWMRELRTDAEFEAFQRALCEDQVDMLQTGRSSAVDADWIVPRAADAQAFHADLQRSKPARRTALDIASAGLVCQFHPLDAVRTPWPSGRALFVHAADDLMSPSHHAQELAAATGGHVVVLADTGHYELYDPDVFPRVIETIHVHALRSSATAGATASATVGAPAANPKAGDP